MKTEQLSPFLILLDGTIVEALQKIDSNNKGILFVVSEKQRLIGVVTDGDIRRWLIKTGKLQGTVAQAMNREPKVICQKELSCAKMFIEKYSLTALPVINAKGFIIDVIFREETKKEKNTDLKQMLDKIPVVIMAGGKGARLYPFTKILPKPLIPIGDVPIIERIINRFQSFGSKEFYMAVNYRKSMIKAYFSENKVDYDIHYMEEEKPLGTAGALSLLPKEFEEPFIVTNCDTLIYADYNDIYQYHKNMGNEITIVAALKNIVIPYGVIRSGENGVVQKMEEKPKQSYFVNTGMYILNPELVKKIPSHTFFHMTDLTDELLKENRKIGMYPISEESFLDMGEFEEMHRMEEKLNLKSE